MSLNQLTQSSTKKWLIAKTFDLVVDGNIKVVNPNARHGDVLTCTSNGIAEFVPLTVTPSLPSNYFNMDSGGSQVIPSFFNFSLVPGYANANFTITTPSSLTCNTSGLYWINKKITRASGSGGCVSTTTKNAVHQDYSVLALPQNSSNTAGCGICNGYLMQLVAGDVIREIFEIIGTAYQNDTTRPTTNIMFIKIE